MQFRNQGGKAIQELQETYHHGASVLDALEETKEGKTQREQEQRAKKEKEAAEVQERAEQERKQAAQAEREANEAIGLGKLAECPFFGKYGAKTKLSREEMQDLLDKIVKIHRTW